MTLPVFPEEDDCILPGGHRFAAKWGWSSAFRVLAKRGLGGHCLF